MWNNFSKRLGMEKMHHKIDMGQSSFNTYYFEPNFSWINEAYWSKLSFYLTKDWIEVHQWFLWVNLEPDDQDQDLEAKTRAKYVNFRKE